MKKTIGVCVLIAALITLVLGFLNLIGIMTTKINWGSFSTFLVMGYMGTEQFLVMGEPNKTKKARVIGAVMFLACVLNLLIFIKSIFR